MLTALIDLASDSEIRRQFITQLPGFLKTLIQRIGAAPEVHASEAEHALTCVWSVLREAVSAGGGGRLRGAHPERRRVLSGTRGVKALVQLPVRRTFEGSPARRRAPAREAALAPQVGQGFPSTCAVRLEGTLLLLVLLVAAGPVCGPSGFAGAAEPPTSFARVAAAARAASIVIRAPDAEGSASSVPVDFDPDEEQLEGLSAGRERILGGGVIVDPQGIALTSARAVRLESGFEVAMIDGTLLKATVMGLDRRTDVAVLKLHSDAPLPHLPLGDSDLVRVGDWVIAVGVPAGLEGTVSAGIITATPTPETSSPLANFLQTDAAMGRGNVGGPVVAMSGEIVGLGTVLSGKGIGYALPAKIVWKVYLELLEKGRVSRPWLGATMQSVTADLARAFGARAGVGVLIADILPTSPAASAGLRSGDIVVEVGGTVVSSRAQVERVIGRLTPGRLVRLRVRRESHELVVSVKLGEEPDEWQVVPALVRARRLFGIDVRPITPTMGAVIVDVDSDGPADVVGIEPGDVIREVGRQPVHNISDFQGIVRTLRAASEVLMLVQRADAAVYVVLRTRQ